MGNGFKHGAGGNDLAFSVKVYPSVEDLPAAALSNTIAVITDTPMTDFCFKSEAPDPVQGRVWMQTNASSKVPFNAQRKDSLMVYPVVTKQYVDGAWIGKGTKTFQNGEWVSWWNGEIFDSGRFYFSFVKPDTENMGGYTTTKTAGKSKGSVTFDDEEIYISCYEESGGNNSIQFCGTADKIDMSRHTRLNVSFSSLQITNSEGRNWVTISASPEKTFPGDGTGSAYKKVTSANGADVHSIDISNIDQAYIVITAHEYSSSTKIHAHIDKIWLE